MAKNPYRSWVQRLIRLQAHGATLPLGGLPAPRRPILGKNAPTVLIFSPHPDDECIVGGLALRLLRERRMRVINVAVTLGSRPERRDAREKELAAACAYLGFELELAGGSGLEEVNAEARVADAVGWSTKVRCVAEILSKHQPIIILLPHEQDGHRTHVGTHLLVMDALRSLPGFSCRVVETEFWTSMASPNLMLELSPRDVADLVAALSFHIGEVQRNPYHLRLPAWMQDNVRRGAELVGGRGAAAPDFKFATLYRARVWQGQFFLSKWEAGLRMDAHDDLRVFWKTDQA